MGKGIKYGSGGGGASIKNAFLRKYYSTGNDIPGGMLATRTATAKGQVLTDVTAVTMAETISVKLNKNTYLGCVAQAYNGNAQGGNAFNFFTVKENSDETYSVIGNTKITAQYGGKFARMVKIDSNKCLLSYIQNNTSTATYPTVIRHRIITLSEDNTTISISNEQTTSLRSTYTTGSGESFNFPDMAVLPNGRTVFAYYRHVYIFEVNGDTVEEVAVLAMGNSYAGLGPKVAIVSSNEIVILDTNSSSQPLYATTIYIDNANKTMTMGTRSTVKGTVSYYYYYPVIYDNGHLIFTWYNTINVSKAEGGGAYGSAYSVQWTSSSTNSSGSIAKTAKNTYTSVGVNTANYRMTSAILDPENETLTLYTKTGIETGISNLRMSPLLYAVHTIDEAATLMIGGTNVSTTSTQSLQPAIIKNKFCVSEGIPTTTADLAITFSKCSTRLPGKAYTST